MASIFDLCEILFTYVGETRFVILLSTIDSCGYRGVPKAADHRGYGASSRGRPIVVNPRNKVVDVERYFLDGSTFPTQPRIIEENHPHRENARVMRVLDRVYTRVYYCR